MVLKGTCLEELLEGGWKEGESLGLFHPNPVKAKDRSQD